MSTNKNSDVKNWVVLTLRAAADGEARYATNGRVWASVRAFLSQGKDKSTGEYRPSLFFTVKAFGEDGEDEPKGAVAAIQNLEKGDRFTAKGRLGLEQWTADDGKERQTLVIFASDIEAAEEEAAELEGEPG